MAHLLAYVDEIHVEDALTFNEEMDPIAERHTGGDEWVALPALMGEIYPDHNLMIWYQDSEMRSYGVSGP